MISHLSSKLLKFLRKTIAQITELEDDDGGIIVNPDEIRKKLMNTSVKYSMMTTLTITKKNLCHL